MIKKVENVPCETRLSDAERSFRNRYPEQYATFKELKADIHRIIDENIKTSEIFADGYAETGRQQAIRKAVMFVLNEIVGFHRWTILYVHDEILHLDVVRTDDEKHYFLTFDKDKYEEYLKWAETRKDE